MREALPTRHASTPNSHDVKRRVFCRHYDMCLDMAIKKNWEGFSCEQCEAYECVRLNSEQWDEDHTRCAALLYSIAFAHLKRPRSGNRMRNRLR